MGEMAQALATANKLMERSGANRPGATIRLAHRSVWTFVTGFLVIGALFAGYALWLKVSSARTAELASAAQTKAVVQPVVTPVPTRVVAPSAPTPVPRDPELEEAFDRIVLNGFRTDPPRVLIGGKLYSIGSELLPGLMLKEIDGRTVVVEDNAGAIYRRTF